jgi:hypothetical protein
MVFYLAVDTFPQLTEPDQAQKCATGKRVPLSDSGASA